MEVIEQEVAIFESAGQAVHVAFLVMAQEAMQDAPLRMALIRMMESVKLDDGQSHWLDQLKGTRSGAVNFGGLTGGEIRAQCALITQAVKTKLPTMEKWVLQAKFGETEHEDISLEDGQLPAPKVSRVSRRFAFSAERIAAIKGLSEYFQPQFPRVNPLAMDFMLGRLYANHKKLDISSRDLAKQFGGNHTKYLRASYKLKNQLRILEQQAIARLEPTFMRHGVIAEFH
ncbi:hypothetical protein INH39_02925 [Massilia violaceinigra]|uniref:Antirepressor protein C-terminal domain-containing protein n=1 Tax=Massilia violaceinigra TaxID=2045208 RepID=A0ABY4A7H6_9BURK|nr:hypothetical protein [Massilia violaceinigra]UOD30715.1 hypothetical protein INH39_02925 [Massilia violaceinigra]